MANKSRDSSREIKTTEAIEFVKLLWDAPIDRICIENPKGVLSTRWRKPTQIIQPWHFGDRNIKMTCLWLKGLPRLNGLVEVALNKGKYIPEPYKIFPSGRKQYWTQMIGDSVKRNERGHHKSRTFEVFAKAMAEQWGKIEVEKCFP